jgi:hypothetical protein
MAWRLTCGFILALLAVFGWIHSGLAAKINRVTDKDGTVHISNEAATEPGKPGGASGPTPIGTLPPQQIFPPPPGQEAAAPPVAPPPEAPDMGTEPPAAPPAEQSAPEAGSEAQPVQPPIPGRPWDRGARTPPR